MEPEISVGEFKRRLAQLCLQSAWGGLPRKRLDRHILYQSVLLTMEGSREYSQKEIDAVLRSWLEDLAPSIHIDHVNLRRELVDEEFLTRTPDGSSYTVAGVGPRRIVFSPEVAAVDVRTVVEEARRKRAERKSRVGR